MKINKLILLLILIFVSSANASDNIKPWTNLGNNLESSYTGWNAFYHISAIGLTYAIVESGYDGKILENTSKLNSNFRNIYGHAGIFSGYILPIAVPVSMYFSSEKNSDLRTASYAIAQSISIAFTAGTLLKAITGRKPPKIDHPDKEKLSRGFRFGIMEGGLHYGWPSGHLMVNTAFVTTLSTFYPEKTWIQYLSYGYIAFLTTSVLFHGEAHWFSDIVAGGLMGYAIGSAVGKNFYQIRKQNNKKTFNTSTQIIPLFNKDFTGISLTVGF